MKIRDKETCLKYVEDYIDDLNNQLMRFHRNAIFIKSDNVIIMDELMLLNKDQIKQWIWDADITAQLDELMIEGDYTTYLEFKNVSDAVLFKVSWPFEEIEPIPEEF